jgi:predicted ATPase
VARRPPRGVHGEGIIERAILPPDPARDRTGYPWGLAAVRALDEPLVLDPKVTIFVGENGSGKSTLLEAIAVAAGFNPEGGTTNFDFETRRSHSPLCDALLLEWARRPRTGFFFRGESFFNVATEMERLDEGTGDLLKSYGGRSLHEQSHGEAFLALVNNRFGPDGLYVLDEPEQALAPQRQLSLLAAIHALVLRRSQFVIATHSPILMAYPGAKLLGFGATYGDQGVRETTWQETEHVQVYRGFLNDPERWLKHLLEATGEQVAAADAAEAARQAEKAEARRRARKAKKSAPGEDPLDDPEIQALLRPRGRRRPPLEITFEQEPAEPEPPPADG